MTMDLRYLFEINPKTINYNIKERENLCGDSRNLRILHFFSVTFAYCWNANLVFAPEKKNRKSANDQCESIWDGMGWLWFGFAWINDGHMFHMWIHHQNHRARAIYWDWLWFLWCARNRRVDYGHVMYVCLLCMNIFDWFAFALRLSRRR